MRDVNLLIHFLNYCHSLWATYGNRPLVDPHNREIYYLSVFNRDTGTIILPGSLFTLCPYPTILEEFPIYPGLGEGTFCLLFNPFPLSGSLFTLRSYLTFLAEVTMYPERFTALLLRVSRPLLTLSSSAFAVILQPYCVRQQLYKFSDFWENLELPFL